MDKKKIERCRRATEYDGMWFCDNCERMVSWKHKSFKVGNKHLCKDCVEKYLK